MPETEISILKNEIARQNRIIEALLTHNEQLRAENANLKNETSPEHGSYSVSEIEKSPIDGSYSITEKGKGIPTGSNAVPEKEKGMPADSNSVSEIRNGIPTENYSILEKMNGMPISSNAVSKTGNGINTGSNSIPEKVEPSTGNILRVNANFRAIKGGKMKRSGSKNIAKLLIHIHNGNSGSYPELRKATGLSEGGVGKLVMSLKKRGLIVSSGWQRFSLTDAGRQLLM
jgi:biotin operon repressor